MLRTLLSLIPVVIIFVIALAFGAQNDQSISVDFFFGQAELSVASLLAIFIGIGFLIGLVSMAMNYWRMRLQIRKLKKQLTAASSAAHAMVDKR